MRSPIKILHLEDNKNDAELIKETLLLNELDCEITLIDNKEAFIRNLADENFDVILADYNLPSFDGLTALAMATKYAKDVPFIFISGVLGEDLAVETLKKGAVDYVIKSRLERLVPAITRAIREKEEKAKRILLEREIIELEQMSNELRNIYQELTKRVRGFIKIELPSNKYIVVDKFLEDLSGYKIEDWKNTPNFISTILHPDYIEYYQTNISQFIEGYVPKILEYKIVRSDHEERWWLQFNIGAFDIDGKLTSVSAIIIDNTDDKETQLKYQYLFENALTGMYRSDIETGVIIEANEKMAEIFGFSSVDEFKNHKALDFYPDATKRKELIDLLNKNGFYEEIVHQLKRNDDKTVWIMESARIYPDRGYIEGLIIDITDRKRAEDSLQRDRRVYQTIAEAAVHSKTVKELCEKVLTGLIENLGYDAGTVSLFNTEDEMLYPIVFVGISETEKEKLLPKSINEPNHVSAIVAKTKKSIFLSDVLKNDDIKIPRLQIGSLNIRAIATWPIFSANEKLLGVLQLVSKEPKISVEDDHLLFDTIAELLASVLEHKKAEEALRESEEKFRAFAEQSLIGVSLITKNGQFLFINDEIVKISEFSHDEFFQGKLKDITSTLFKEEDLKRLETQIDYTREKKIPSQIEEYQITSKNGHLKWVSIHLTPIKIQEDYAIGLVALDISDEKQAQLTLNREQQAFHILAEAILQATNIADLCQRILTGLVETLKFSAGTFRLFDEKKKILYPYAIYMLDKNRIDNIKPLSINDSTYLNTHVARTKEPVFAPDILKNEIAMKYYNRLSTFDAKATLTWPILNAENDLLGVIQIVANKPMDFTNADKFFFETIARFFATALEREWSKEALAESREKYRRLIETLPFAIFQTDLDGKVLVVNRQALDILSVTEKGILGKSIFDYFIDKKQVKIITDLKANNNLGSLREVEFLILDSTSKTIPIKLSISIITNESQKAEGYIFISQDF
ncbi:MAG: PAS domain S-box protein [Candidatus Heimdallarchaeota archaeon]|nr:PAS domain S-box protein [Candidatus Heimdallarchaeota archaeon]